MKNLFLFILLALTSFATFADVGPVGRSTGLDLTGAVQSGSEEKWFINVVNRDGSSAAAKTLMCVDTANDDGYSAITCPVTAGGLPLCVLESACADDAVCRCQTYGYVSGVNFSDQGGNAVAGQPAYLSEDIAGYVIANASAGGGDNPIGIYYDAASATGTVELFLRMR